MHTYTHIASGLFLTAMTKPEAQRLALLASLGKQISQQTNGIGDEAIQSPGQHVAEHPKN